MNDKGDIREVKNTRLCINRGEILEHYFEVFEGKKWLGKAYSEDKAKRVAKEILKFGNYEARNF